jgi:hypothetical protein
MIGHTGAVGTLASDVQAAEADARWRFGLFSALLALALILHQLWWNGFEVPSPHFGVVLAAFWVLLHPTSVARLLTMLALEVVAVWLDMPGAGSHTLLVAVCGASVLLYAAGATASARRLPDPAVFFTRIAPFLRVSLLVLYAAAALAKMNSGYVDAAVSCAAAMLPSVVWFDPSLVDAPWLFAPAMWGSVLIEAALPVLLVLPRTRAAGLILGTAFHLVLALAGNVPFSSIALAFYVAFLPPGLASRMRAVALARRPSWAGAWIGPAALATLAGLWTLGGMITDAEPSSATTAVAWGTRLVVVAVVLAAAALALAARRAGGRRARPGRLGLRLAHPAFIAGVGLLVLNAMAPYLGLKTESAFTMFSNLQTEAGSWNHAFIPESVRVFGYQDELVRVTASDDPTLVRRTSRGTRMVRFELERHLRRNPGVRATWTDGSVPPRTAVAAGGLSALAIVDKVAKFRDVRAPQRRGC